MQESCLSLLRLLYQKYHRPNGSLFITVLEAGSMPKIKVQPDPVSGEDHPTDSQTSHLILTSVRRKR